MQDAKVEARIRRKFRLVAVELDERRRRQWAAVDARDAGWGGISLVARATGLSRPTIMSGLKELDLSSKIRTVAAARVRQFSRQAGTPRCRSIDSQIGHGRHEAPPPGANGFELGSDLVADRTLGGGHRAVARVGVADVDRDLPGVHDPLQRRLVPDRGGRSS